MRCAHATQVMSDELDGASTAEDRLAARLHEAVCPGCRRVRVQLQGIDRWLRNATVKPPEPGGLSEDARRRIRRLLRDQQATSDKPEG
ncbi:hypothetical protein Pla111_02740 [Botrimarina hoheduenensis]|uniref:Zinc-finger domain-containing protein n=2 Tax=Botrimarina hoheduenensis TaxID=2528000 RepID=A0A5C5WCV8_9BACT|nr:hypothetical protein Pla111_02740 [Botrimarina hoheduenensis]